MTALEGFKSKLLAKWSSFFYLLRIVGQSYRRLRKMLQYCILREFATVKITLLFASCDPVGYHKGTFIVH